MVLVVGRVWDCFFVYSWIIRFRNVGIESFVGFGGEGVREVELLCRIFYDFFYYCFYNFLKLVRFVSGRICEEGVCCDFCRVDEVLGYRVI